MFVVKFFSSIKRNDIFNATVNILTSFQAKPLSSPTEKPTLTTSVGNRIWWKCLGTTGSAPWFGPSPPQSFRTMASTGTRQRPGSKRVPKTDEVCRHNTVNSCIGVKIGDVAFSSLFRDFVQLPKWTKRHF